MEEDGEGGEVNELGEEEHRGKDTRDQRYETDGVGTREKTWSTLTLSWRCNISSSTEFFFLQPPKLCPLARM